MLVLSGTMYLLVHAKYMLVLSKVLSTMILKDSALDNTL